MADQTDGRLRDDVALLMRRAIVESLPGRTRRVWRDVALAVNSGLLVLLLVFVAALFSRRPSPPGLWVWTNPDTGVTYQCALISDAVPAYQCVPQRRT